MKIEKPEVLSVKSEDKMIDLLQQFDWSKTTLGDNKLWPAALQNSVNICMHSRQPILILWGNDLTGIYNDAYRKIIGNKHPEPFGAPAKQVWQELWDETGLMLNDVLREGKSFLYENHPFILNRNGYPEECFFTFSYSPIYESLNKVEGVFVSAIETTHVVHNETLLRNLRNRQLENLFLQAPIAMCILKGAEHVVEVANEKMLELWGKSASQVMNKPLFEGLSDAGNQGFEEMLYNVYNKGERVAFDEIPITLFRKGKLESVFVKFVYEALREQDGTISGVMVMADEVTEQVNTRKKTEESEERLRLAIESTKVGTWDYNPITSELTWSEECKKIYDFPPDATINFKMFSEHIYPADKDFVEREIQKSMDPDGPGVYDITYRIIQFNKKNTRWIRAKGKVFFNAQKKAERFIGTVVDITDQKLLEETIRESEMRARLAVEATEMGTFDWNITNASFQYSERLAQMFGYSSTEGLNQESFGSRIHPDDQPMRKEAHEKAFREGTLFYEARIILPDNSVSWVRLNGIVVYDDQGNPIRMHGTTLDITDDKNRAEKLEQLVFERTVKLHERNLALKNSEERYHKMVEEVQDYAIILLDKDGIIRNWNKGAERIKYYTEQEIIGKHFSIFYLPEDQKNNLPQNLINLASETGRALQEGWRKRKDGTKFWGSITITALHSEDNSIIGFSKVTRDLTDKKLAEEKLLEYTRELELQNSELEQFAYVASHDLQEPLRKIQTFSEIIQNNITDEHTVKKYFAKLNNSAQRMSDLIKSVLNYSNLVKEGIQMAEIDLNVIINGVLIDFELLIEEKGATITVDKLPIINGNALQLSQLFSNLISNSLKFSDKKPVITINSRSVTISQMIDQPEFLPDKVYTELTFTDNGIGFDQQYEKLIFTMFQRLHGKQEYAGTGIGLAICKKIVDNHGGYIAAKGELGKGAIFYVYLLNT